MKLKIATILLAAITPYAAKTQTSIDKILQSVESNNLTLAAIWNENKSQKYANTGEVTLPDPEVTFNYLWGKPAEAGSKKQISATQGFDLSTLLGLRGEVARTRNTLLDIEYSKARKEILLEAEKCCYQVIYHNAVEAELNKQLRCAKHITHAYGETMEDGSTGQLEYNRARLSAILLQGELRKNDIARDEALTQLAKLNGGMPVTLPDTTFAQVAPLPPFDMWYAQAMAADPTVEYADNLVQLRNKEVRLGKSMWAPKITAGYTAEIEPYDTYQGVALGINIPLWGSRNSVKQAKAATIAAQSRAKELHNAMYYDMKYLYDKTLTLQQNVQMLKKEYSELDGIKMLGRNVALGNITFVEYQVEATMYYEAMLQILSVELEYYRSLADMNAYAL